MELLRMEHITKIYTNGFVANKDISFAVDAGDIYGLMGENGAGKTTLMKILFGMEDAQEGDIYINGERTVIDSPLKAIAKGVGMVNQHFMLLPSLTVAENVVLGIEPMKHGFFDFEKAVEMTQNIADKYNFRMDVRSKVGDLSVGLMQKVEILKALIRGAKVIILDEPTAVLTPQETTELFEQLRMLRNEGNAIIFISHKLEEVMALCNKVMVLRHGYSCGNYETKDLTEQKLSRLMVGRDVILKMQKDPPIIGKDIVTVKNLVINKGGAQNAVDGVSLSIREGEIVGIAGVEGNGQNELSEAISGTCAYLNGDISVNGTNIKGKSVHQIRDLGLAYIPEDRMTMGCASNLSVKENIIADRFRRRGFTSGIFMNTKRIDEEVSRLIDEFEISCDDSDEPVRMLSGGNIQKVVVAREFSSGGNFILANQPTRGVDVGTAEVIRKALIRKVRTEKMGALLISADLNEIMEVSDRLLVMRKGKVVAAFSHANEITEEELGEYMLGVKAMTKEEMAVAL